MNNLELKMLDALKDLKENHHVLGVKAEFEAEGTRMEEAMRLKEVVTRAGLDLTIKIGGCEAVKDMYDARTIGVSAIVAPMIESAYALSKYIKRATFVFPQEERAYIKFLFNIETITGLNALEEMLTLPQADQIAGVVFGRTDMTGSLGMDKDDINHPRILQYAQKIAKLTQKYHKELVIGGGVSADSLPFFAQLPAGALTRFETRKVIFDAPRALSAPNAATGILKAVAFEILWLKNKRHFYQSISQEDENRLQVLQGRYGASIAAAGGVVA